MEKSKDESKVRRYEPTGGHLNNVPPVSVSLPLSILKITLFYL